MCCHRRALRYLDVLGEPGGRVDGLVQSSPVGAMLRVAERRPWHRRDLVVLTYHRVSDRLDDGRHIGLVSADPSTFARQLDALARTFTFVTVQHVIAAVRGEADLPPRSLLLTFDDAVDDFERHAWPALRERQVPSALFVPTGYVGRADLSFWWDAVHAAITTTSRRRSVETPIGPLPLGTEEERRSAFRVLRGYLAEQPASAVEAFAESVCDDLGVRPPPAQVLPWPALRRLHQSGLVEICPHTRTHRHLDLLPPDEIRAEVEGSQEDVRREVGDCVPAFAYPAGRSSPEATRVVAESGIAVAFTTERGPNRLPDADPLLLRRINVGRRYGLNGARLQALSGVAARLGPR